MTRNSLLHELLGKANRIFVAVTPLFGLLKEVLLEELNRITLANSSLDVSVTPSEKNFRKI